MKELTNQSPKVNPDRDDAPLSARPSSGSEDQEGQQDKTHTSPKGKSSIVEADGTGEDKTADLPQEIKICWVCKKEKKPYLVFLKDDIIDYLTYLDARKNGEICERCDKYYAMTGEFKDSTEEEFNLAVDAIKFAYRLRDLFEEDKLLDSEKENKLEWKGTKNISSWYRNKYQEKL